MEYDTPRRIVWRLLCLLLGALLALLWAVWPTHAQAPPLTLSWRQEQTVLVVAWTEPGCVYLAAGLSPEVLIPGGCGAGGVVELSAVAGGDAAYLPQRHPAVIFRPWNGGAAITEPIPARRWRAWLPVAARP